MFSCLIKLIINKDFIIILICLISNTSSWNRATDKNIFIWYVFPVLIFFLNSIKLNKLKKYSLLVIFAATSPFGAIIGEEFGFFGMLVIFFLFFSFLYYSIKILHRVQDLFGFFLGIGITMNIVIYFLINSAYVVGIFPTTGLPLPFMSYGGSHIILSLASMGIMFNMANNNLRNRKII